jgi:hypothetical protein
MALDRARSFPPLAVIVFVLRPGGRRRDDEEKRDGMASYSPMKRSHSMTSRSRLMRDGPRPVGCAKIIPGNDAPERC